MSRIYEVSRRDIWVRTSCPVVHARHAERLAAAKTFLGPRLAGIPMQRGKPVAVKKEAFGK